MADKKAVFFCSAVTNIDPKYIQAAREIVRAACLQGYDIVSGGTTEGLMNVVCDTASSCGAKVIGVLPRFMEGIKNPALSECIWTDKMSQRKDAMREGTSVAIALPGGVGTLDELSETYCLAKMGIYPGRVIVFNQDGFYDDYRRQLELFVQENMMSAQALSLIHFPSTIEELTALL